MESDRRFLEMALAEAEESFRKGTYPVGAVLVGPDGQVVEPCLMCTGALMNADIARVVFATADNWLGALRAMKAGGWKAERFAKVEMLSAPFPDLDRRQRALLAAWDSSRGLDGSMWLVT